MGQLPSSAQCSPCSCEDTGDKVNTLTLDPSSLSVGEGAVNMLGATPGQDMEVSVCKSNAIIKQPEIGKPEIVSFKVTIAKTPSENFGLAHMPMEDGSQSLLVVELRPDGPMTRWNMEQRAMGRADFDVRRGDRIVNVGNLSDIEGMRELLRQDNVEFAVERWPQVVSVLLKKGEPTDKYGMQTDLIIKDDGAKVLRVGKISGGLLGEWNTQAAESRRFFEVIGQFSEITSVNEEKVDSERMQQMLVTEPDVKITFHRPDPELFNV